MLPILRDNATSISPSRVICTGSKLEKRSDLGFKTTIDDLKGINSPVKNSYFQAYANSKHGIHLCVNALADKEPDIKFHTASPGMVDTRLNRFLSPALLFLTWPFRKVLLNTPERGASSVLHAATSREAANTTAKFYDSNQPLDKGGFGVTRGATTDKDLALQVYAQATHILAEVFK